MHGPLNVKFVYRKVEWLPLHSRFKACATAVRTVRAENIASELMIALLRI